jgi:hypothetical protein
MKIRIFVDFAAAFIYATASNYSLVEYSTDEFPDGYNPYRGHLLALGENQGRGRWYPAIKGGEIGQILAEVGNQLRGELVNLKNLPDLKREIRKLIKSL